MGRILMDQEINEKLKEASTDSLLAEIERREIKRPKMIHNFAYGALQEVCQNHLNTIDQDDDNFKDKIYRAAMEMWFGEDVWKYINAICGMNSNEKTI